MTPSDPVKRKSVVNGAGYVTPDKPLLTVLTGSMARPDQKKGTIALIAIESINGGELLLRFYAWPFAQSSLPHVYTLRNTEGVDLTNFTGKSHIIDGNTLLRFEAGLGLDFTAHDIDNVLEIDLEHCSERRAAGTLETYFKFRGDKSRQPFSNEVFDYQSWNPFLHLHESQTYPLARLLRTTFWEKLTDTFYVFAESRSPYGQDCKYLIKLGLLDYIFPVPMLLRGLSALPVGDIASVFVMGAYLLTSLVNTIAAALLTVCLSPVVGLVHAVTSCIKASDVALSEHTFTDFRDAPVSDTSDIGNLDESDFSQAALSVLLENPNDYVIKPIVELSDDEAVSPYRDCLEEDDQDNTTYALAISKPGLGAVGVIPSTALVGQSLFPLMQQNICHIDEELEKAGVMERFQGMIN